MKKRAVLGIDAAWTAGQPSGVALVAGSGSTWRLVGCAASYQRFLALADPALMAEVRPMGMVPPVAALLDAARQLCGMPVDLVAVDMPMARLPITGRRHCDNEISRVYGGRKCGTHSASAARPGPISAALTLGAARGGYPLLTIGAASPGLVEVYPHPALLELTGAQMRLPYKAAKAAKYWPEATPVQRRERLAGQWAIIVAALEGEIAGVADALPLPSPDAVGWRLKAFEDTMDAVICAWVGRCVLEGRARAHGDEDGTIWVPAPI